MHAFWLKHFPALPACLVSLLIANSQPACCQVPPDAPAVDQPARSMLDAELTFDTELDSAFADEEAKFLTVEPVYFGEVFTNARGGKSTKGATQYQGLLDLAFRFDFDHAEVPLPGSFYMLAQNTHGRGLTEDFVGDTQVVSNIDSFNNLTQVGEYWWQSDWLDDYVTFRVGKQDMNTEFQCINASENFVQSTFGLSPSTAFPTYPSQALGVVTLVQLLESTRLKFGAWSAFARAGSWGHSGSDSFMVVGELERTFALVEGRLPGIVAIGALYESDGELEDQFVSAVREYYIQFEQKLYQEKPWESDDNQGLMLFAGYYPRFPGEEVLRESIGDSAVVGLTYTGLVNGRDDDMLGLGLSWAELYQGGTNEETATEVFYRAPLSPRMIVQPDMQYISSPSGIYRDALVAGFRFEVRPR